MPSNIIIVINTIRTTVAPSGVTQDPDHRRHSGLWLPPSSARGWTYQRRHLQLLLVVSHAAYVQYNIWTVDGGLAGGAEAAPQSTCFNEVRLYRFLSHRSLRVPLHAFLVSFKQPLFRAAAKWQQSS